MVQLITRFETSITRNDAYGISLNHLSYLITLIDYLCSQRTPNFQMKCFMFAWSIFRLIVLNRIWIHDSLQIVIFVYVWSTWNIVEFKTRFETWITSYYVNGVSLFILSNLIKLKAYLSSQRTPNVQINYFVFHCSIYRLFVLNSVWKSDSIQMINIRKCLLDMKHGTTKNGFESWITRKDVYGTSLMHLYYLITLMA
jgi:hypothetical protein